MRAYKSQNNFYGEWDKYINSALSLLNTLARILQANTAYKREALPLMLLDAALGTYESILETTDNFCKASTKQIYFYNSAVKRDRLLITWQKMRLWSKMCKSPE